MAVRQDYLGQGPPRDVHRIVHPSSLDHHGAALLAQILTVSSSMAFLVIYASI